MKLAQVKYLIDRVLKFRDSTETHLQLRKLPVIICGDFNSTPGDVVCMCRSQRVSKSDPANVPYFVIRYITTLTMVVLEYHLKICYLIHHWILRTKSRASVYCHFIACMDLCQENLNARTVHLGSRVLWIIFFSPLLIG